MSDVSLTGYSKKSIKIQKEKQGKLGTSMSAVTIDLAYVLESFLMHDTHVCMQIIESMRANS